MGFISDKLNHDFRNLFLLIFQIIMIILSIVLYITNLNFEKINIYLAVALFSGLSFALNGPYSLPGKTIF